MFLFSIHSTIVPWKIFFLAFVLYLLMSWTNYPQSSAFTVCILVSNSRKLLHCYKFPVMNFYVFFTLIQRLEEENTFSKIPWTAFAIHSHLTWDIWSTALPNAFRHLILVCVPCICQCSDQLQLTLTDKDREKCLLCLNVCLVGKTSAPFTH